MDNGTKTNGFTTAVRMSAPNIFKLVWIESSNTFGRLSSTELEILRKKNEKEIDFKHFLFSKFEIT